MGSCALNPVGCVGLPVVASVFHALVSVMAGAFAGVAAWLLRGCGAVLSGSADRGAVMAASAPTMARVEHLTPVIALLCLAGTAIMTTVRGEGGVLARRAVVGVPLVVLGIGLSRPLADLALRIGDELSVAVAAPMLSHGQLSGLLVSVGGPVPPLGVAIVAVVAVVITFLLWCELLVRNVALAVLLAVTPLVVPLALLPSLRRVATRLAETFLLLVAAKVAVALTLSVGLAMLSVPHFESAVTGVVALLLASLSPLVLLRLIPLFEGAALHAVGGLRGQFSRGVSYLSNSPWRAAVEKFMPDAPLIGPPVPPEDFDIPMAEGVPLPEEEPVVQPAERPAPPIVRNPSAKVSRGKMVVYEDEMGPVIGWHWDDW